MAKCGTKSSTTKGKSCGSKAGKSTSTTKSGAKKK